jgi:hypothetical protein
MSEVAHGIPSAAELVAAMRGYLEDEVMVETDGRRRFLARVSANVATTVERELTEGDRVQSEHRKRLDSLGCADDAQLRGAIRAGDFDDRVDELVRVLVPDVIERLRLWNPQYLEPVDVAT